MADDGAQVWVVDDDRAVRFVLAAALSEAGYEVSAFDGAAAALGALGQRPPPQLLFTDVRMPGDSGLQLLDALKRDHPQLPVVVMSAYTDVASTAGAFRGGAHEFLSKPFDLDDAVALAGRVLSKSDKDTTQLVRTTGSEFDVEVDDPRPVQVDGDVIGEASRMRVTVDQQALIVRVASTS